MSESSNSSTAYEASEHDTNVRKSSPRLHRFLLCLSRRIKVTVISDVDPLLYAPVFLQLLADIVSSVAPTAGVLAKSVAQLMDHLDEQKSLKTKRNALTVGIVVLNTLKTASSIAFMLEGTHMEEHASDFVQNVQEVLEEVRTILMHSRNDTYNDMNVGHMRIKLEGCATIMNGHLNDLIMKFHAINTAMHAQNLKMQEDNMRIQEENTEKHIQNEERQHAIGRALGELIDCLSKVLNEDANSEVSGRFKTLVDALKDNTDLNIIEEMSSFHAEKAIDMTQTNSHVDAESFKRFQTCIKNIIGYENGKVFTNKDIQFEEGVVVPDRSMLSEGIVRKGIIKFPNPDGHGSWGLEVAVKTPRSSIDQTVMDSLSKRFTREIFAQTLFDLKHRNVVPFYGVYRHTESDGTHHFGLVSKFQRNSNLRNYVSANVRVNRFQLLFEAARGLEFIHSKGVYHGHVRCSNIFVDEFGIAGVGDFTKAYIPQSGIYKSRIWRDTFCPSELPSEDWKAPERFGSITKKGTRPSAESDVYSFAMTILECLTLRDPFWGKVSYMADLERCLFPTKKDCSLSDKRPNRPENNVWIDDSLWGLLMKCWADEPERRLTMKQVMHMMAIYAETHKGSESHPDRVAGA